MIKTQVLEEIGLTKNESHVYLAILDIGQSTLCELKERTKLHRSNIYDSLEGLKKKGLVSYILKDEKKYYEVPAPEQLFTILREKEFRLNKIMPELLLSKQLTKEESQACIYEGIFSVQKLMMNALSYKEPILIYGFSKNAAENLKRFMRVFHERRIKEKISMKIIYNFDIQEPIKILNGLALTEAKVLPQEFDANVSTHICNGEVILILWNQNPFVVQIRNTQISDAYRRYFEILWASAK